MFRVLNQRFTLNNSSIIKVFNYIKLYLRDMVVDFDTIVQFVQQKLRFIKNINILNLDRSN